MATEALNQQCPTWISFQSTIRLALAPLCVFTALIIISALEGLLGLLLWLFSVTSAPGAIVMTLLYQADRDLGARTAAQASLVFYAGLLALVLASRTRWLVYLWFAALLGSVLFSTGAFMLCHLPIKW